MNGGIAARDRACSDAPEAGSPGGSCAVPAFATSEGTRGAGRRLTVGPGSQGASAMYKALSFAGAMLAGAFCAGGAAGDAHAAHLGYSAGYGYGYAYAPPAYAAPAPAYAAPAPSVTVVIHPPAATYAAPAPAYAYTSPSYAAPAYYEARPVPPAPIPSPGYAYVPPTTTYVAPAYSEETEYVEPGYAYAPARSYVEPGYAYAPARTYVAPGYASTAVRVCWHDSFGIRPCRWRCARARCR